jgi:hypothetical protein
MREPINISVPYRLDEFNDVERASKIKQEIIANPSKEAKLRIEVALLTECVRVMSERLTALENKND